jgi:hypothetical protein
VSGLDSLPTIEPVAAVNADDNDVDGNTEEDNDGMIGQCKRRVARSSEN